MSTRALARAGLPVTPYVDLPVGPKPQIVDDAGYEVDSDEIRRVEDAPSQKVDEEGDVEMQDVVAGVGIEKEDKEELLSFADSLVLPYSLARTRQRHLTHLLPHVFTHPPIPSHSRPRARPPPKGTFLFPTPPVAELPLPLKEYHAPTTAPGSAVAPAPAADSPAPDGSTPPPNAKPTAKAKTKERSLAPAHEIECIARVTLSIGPISYPGTEIWMGRFVNPRGEMPKVPKKREKGENAGPAQKKQKQSGQTSQSKASGQESRAGPGASIKKMPAITGMSVRPGQPSGVRPPRPPPIAGPSRLPPGPPRPAGSGTPRPPGARPPIEPDLIQRVNAAATQHPWLSVIIHKAARNTATKEELAKLGRIVARLGKGEGVGEGPLDGITPVSALSTPSTAKPITRPPPSTSAPSTQPNVRPPSASTAPIPSTTAASASTPGSKPVAASATAKPASTAKGKAPVRLAAPAAAKAGDDSSDDELDMTGPPQTGGGPIDPELRPDVSRASSSKAPSSSSAPTPKPPSGPPRTPSVAPTAGPSSQPGQTAVPAAKPGAMTAPMRPPSTLPTPGPAKPTQSTMPAGKVLDSSTLPLESSEGDVIDVLPAAPRPPPPPPPNRIYPLPPPFLLVAFKEMPTDKYLLPLGSQSFVSRVGSPVTSNPAPVPRPAAAATLPVTSAQQDNLGQVHVATRPVEPVSASRGRTRQSLGRGAKDVDHPEIKEETVLAPPDVETGISSAKPPAQAPARSDLLPLPGTQPPRGTVLLSTVVPVEEWLKPDWEKLAQRMPFYTKAYDEAPGQKPPTPNPVATPAVPEAEVPKAPRSPTTRKSMPSTPKLDSKPASGPTGEATIDPKTLLNMGAESFMPPGGNVRAVTIRLEGVDDLAWQKMRWVMDHVNGVETKALGVARPELMETIPTDPSSPTPHVPKPFDPSLHPRLRKAYAEYRKNRIESLLRRVAPRTFPKYRLPAPRSDLKDALADKWAPRTYPMSTRPLYLTSPPPEGVEYEVEEVVQPKRKRGQVEEDVMFEMPVSLDMLDERVEAGAKKSVNRRVGKLKLSKTGARGSTSGSGKVKTYGKRSKPGMICEGCARDDLKVWRKGPGGKGTLCKDCGDMYSAGTLGPLLAPGAASAVREADEAAEEGVDTKPDVDGGNTPGGAGTGAVEPLPTGVDTDTSKGRSDATGPVEPGTGEKTPLEETVQTGEPAGVGSGETHQDDENEIVVQPGGPAVDTAATEIVLEE